MILALASETAAPASAFPIGIVLLATALASAPLADALLRRLARQRRVFFARWGFSHLLVGVALAFLAISVVFALLPRPEPEVGEGDGGASVLAGLYATIAGLGVAAAFAFHTARRLHPERARALGLEAAGSLRAIVAAVAGYVLLLPALFGAMLVWPVLAELLGFDLHQQEVLVGIQSLEGTSLLQAVVIAVFVGPFLEEVVFRGFVQPLFVQNLYERGGVAVTSFLFAALHGAAAFLPLFCLSFFLGWTQLRSRRLAAAWFVHGLHNALTLAFVLGLSEHYADLSEWGGVP